MSNATEHCTFCDLIQGAAEVSVCHEDADSIAFMDIQPVNAGHVLVVPRAHYNSLLDVPPEIGMHLFQVTMRLAGAIRKVTDCEDMNIVVNSGKAAGQDEPHYHVHIIPRRLHDGFDINLPFAGSQMPDRTLLDAMAVQLIAAMRDPMKWGSSGSKGETSGAKAPPMEAGPTVDKLAAKTVEIPVDRFATTVQIPADMFAKTIAIPYDAVEAISAHSADLFAERTVAIPAEELAAMAAATGELRPVSRPSADREVVVRGAHEGVTSGDPSKLGVWHVEEGPHGELVYDKRDRR